MVNKLTMDNQKFSDKVRELITRACEEAARLNNDHIGPGHLLLALLNWKSVGVSTSLPLATMQVNVSRLKRSLEHEIRTARIIGKEQSSDELLKEADKLLKVAFIEAKRLQALEVGNVHILLAMTRMRGEPLASIMKEYGLTRPNIIQALSVQWS